jgi:hypothetical protein
MSQRAASAATKQPMFLDGVVNWNVALISRVVVSVGGVAARSPKPAVAPGVGEAAGSAPVSSPGRVHAGRNSATATRPTTGHALNIATSPVSVIDAA